MKEKLKNKLLGVNEEPVNKQKSMIMLLIWFVFISMVIVYIRNSNNDNNQHVKEETIIFDSIGDIFNKYVNYDYDIKISDIDNNIVKFIGSYKEGIDTGYKVINEEKINYKIENNIIINTDNNEEIENLYDNYLYYFFKPSNIYSYVSYLKNEEKIDVDSKLYTYNYVYDDKDITFEIETSKDLIKNIIIRYNDNKYEIKYSL